MATDIILRSVKAAALTHAEMDQNWESLAQTVDAHTSNATIAVTDQNKILEVSITTGTMTLPTVANATGTDTDSFRVTIKNINSTSLTVDGNGAETIEGSANVSLLENEAATFSLDSGSTEWNILAFYGPNIVGITSTSTEINKLDGFTGVVADLNIISGGNAAGVSATEFQYLNGVTSAIQAQIDAKLVIASNLSDLASAATSRSNLGVDAAGTDNSTDVTLAGTPNYITIVGQVITRALVNLTSHITGTLPIGNGGTNATTASAARTSLGLQIGVDIDAAGTDNSTNVSLTGTPDYITISGQVITRAQIDLTADVTGVLPTANMASIAAGETSQTFTASGTFTAKASGVHTITIIAAGGGGGGGGGGTNGSGGGGGKYAKSITYTQSLTASTGYTATIGAVGTAGAGGASDNNGAAGGTGGTTTFNSTSVTGGAGGAGGITYGGSPSAGTTGEDCIPYGLGGAGGGVGVSGTVGTGTGSGGGGGGGVASGTAANGAAGVAGKIIISW